jgi:DNA polymerase-3 subunit delta
MVSATTKPFTFICGQDDYLVGRQGRLCFDALAAEVADEFSREILSGFASNASEVEAAVNRFRESVQTMPMFGGKRVVWLKDVNFLADSQTGKSEETLRLVDDLQQILQGLNREETAVLVTAAPVDRRRVFPKWCEKTAEFVVAGGDGGDLRDFALAEARAAGVAFGPGSLELVLAKVGPNTRLLAEEIAKLAAYAGDAGPIEEAQVAELTPNTAQGDFFETAEAFFSGDLTWTLASLHRHFFGGGDARPLIAALQNRNRILIQLRVLLDAGEARQGPRGIEGLAQAGAGHLAKFAEAASEKSAYNLFTQNPWYVGKLAGGGRLPPLKRLIDNQRAFVAAFEEIHRRPDEQEDVLRDLSVRCLAG